MNNNRRVFEYVTMGRPEGPTAQGSSGPFEGPAGANEQVIKTPNTGTLFSVYSKSASVATTATLTIQGSFVANPEVDDLVDIVVAFDVSPDILTEVIIDEPLEFPYFKLTYEPGTEAMSTELYITFY